MTQDKNEGSENLNWMEIADTDAINEPRHTGQRLPFIAAAVSLLIIGGGAVFAQTSNEAPAQTEETSVTQTSQSPVAAPSTDAPSMTTGGVPVIPNVAPGGNGSYDDDDEDEDEDDDEYEDDDEDEDNDDDEDEDDD